MVYQFYVESEWFEVKTTSNIPCSYSSSIEQYNEYFHDNSSLKSLWKFNKYLSTNLKTIVKDSIKFMNM